MAERIPYTVVFHWPQMPSHGAGPMYTVWKVDGVLPPTLVDPVEQNSHAVLAGTWRLDGTDEDAKLAIYELS